VKMSDDTKIKITLEAQDKATQAIRNFGNSISDVERKVKGLSGGLGGLTDAITSFINPTTLLIGSVGMASAAIGSMINNAIDNADALNKMSQKTGVAVEDLSALQYAAKLADVDFNELGKSITKLNKAIFESQTNNKELKAIFQSLNISVRNSDGTFKNAFDVLLELADVFENMPDGVEKAKIALELFGRSGIGMIPLLNGGKEGIKSLTDEAEQMGIVITSQTAIAAEAFNDNLTRLKSLVEGGAISLMSEFLPAIANVTNSLVELGTSTGVVNYIFVGLGTAIKSVASLAVAGFGTIYSGIFASISAIKLAVETLVDVVQASLNMVTDPASGMARMQVSLAMLETRFDIAKRATQNFAGNFVDAFQAIWNNKPAEKLDNIAADYASIFDKLQEKIKNKKVELPEILPGKLDNKEFDLANDIDISVYADKMAMMQEITGNELFGIKTQFELTQEEIGNSLTAIAESQRMTLGDSFGTMSNAMMNFYQAFGGKSKAFFTAYKAMAIAEATIKGFQSVLNAYEHGTKVGGPVLGVIEATAAAVYTASLIAKIGASNYNPPVKSNTARNVAGDTKENNNTNNRESSKQVVINIYGSVVDHDKFARDIIPSINKAISDGYAIQGA